jgi:hypothetical protein
MRALIAVALAAAVAASPASASTESKLDCDGKLVALGDTRAEVELKCRAPTSTDRRVETIDDQVVTVDEWVYNRGPLQFVRTLKFINGKLARIDVGDYGN